MLTLWGQRAWKVSEGELDGQLWTLELSLILLGPNVPHKLVSVSILYNNGCMVLFTKKKYMTKRNNMINVIGKLIRGMYAVGLEIFASDHALSALERLEYKLDVLHAKGAQNGRLQSIEERRTCWLGHGQDQTIYIYWILPRIWGTTSSSQKYVHVWRNAW